MKRKARILFVRNVKSSFVETDLKILAKHFEVRDVLFPWGEAADPWGILRAILSTCAGVLWADATFSWFADKHALIAICLSRLLTKRSIVIIGGYEVARLPDIRYGALLDPWTTRIVRNVIQRADRVLVVDGSLRRDAMEHLHASGENILVVPTGYDPEKFSIGNERENSVLTVCFADSWQRARLKGLDVFVEAARSLPDYKFRIIGIEGEALARLKSIAPPNLKLVGPQPQAQVISCYSKTRVYCQLSMREGLPNALCEAMLSGCIPVGTDVQGVRTAIGNAGFLVPYGDKDATVRAILKALKSELGKAARERIKEMFSIEGRERRLIELIDEVVGRR